MLLRYNDWAMIVDKTNALYDWHQIIVNNKKQDWVKQIIANTTGIPDNYYVGTNVIPTAINVSSTPSITTNQTGIVTYTTVNHTAIRAHNISRFPLGPNDDCSPEEWALDQVFKLMRSHGLNFRDVANLLQMHSNPTLSDAYDLPDGLTLLPGDYNLPGGAVLKIADDKSYEIDDSNHKTIHKANPNPDFNEAFCVSEILEQFMGYVAMLKLTKEQFMELPIRLFMLWLIIESCKKDKEPIPEPEFKQLEFELLIISDKNKIYVSA